MTTDASTRDAIARLKRQVRELERPDREARKIAQAQARAARERRIGKREPKIQHARAKPKGGRVRDGAYLSWLHDGLPCVACLVEGQPHTFGEPNPIEAAHQRIRGWKKGVRADDDACVPLCRWHHQLAPNACDKGQRQFWDRLEIDPAELCADLYAAFRAGASGLAVINRFTTRSPAADRLPSGGRDQ